MVPAKQFCCPLPIWRPKQLPSAGPDDKTDLCDLYLLTKLL